MPQQPLAARPSEPLPIPDTLPGIAERVTQAFARYDRGAQECALARLEAGRLLLAAKERCNAAREINGDSEPTFQRWCALNVTRSWRDIKRLVAIAAATNPVAAVQQARATARAGMQVTRERQRRQRQGANVSPSSNPAVAVATQSDVQTIARALAASEGITMPRDATPETPVTEMPNSEAQERESWERLIRLGGMAHSLAAFILNEIRARGGISVAAWLREALDND